MRRAVLLIIAGGFLGACGVDGPPVPPGQDNPDTVQSVDEVKGPTIF